MTVQQRKDCRNCKERIKCSFLPLFLFWRVTTLSDGEVCASGELPNSKSHFLLKSFCPHLRLSELKEIRRKILPCCICLFILVHLTALQTPPNSDVFSFPNRVRFLWLMVQVLSHSSAKRKLFSNTIRVVVKTWPLKESMNILHCL